MIEFQRLILGDRVRNEAFAKALARTIVRGRTTVADLGAGTGFLSFLASRLGAKRCWLYEVSELLDLSRELAKRNGLKNLAFVRAHSTEVAKPPKVDVVISETLGNFALEENALETLQDGRRFLKPGGVMIPQKLRQFVAPVASPRLAAAIDVWGSIGHGLDYSQARAVSLQNVFVRTVRRDDLLATPDAAQVWDAVDFRRDTESVRSTTVEWIFAEPAAIHGFALWWECDVVDGVTLSTAPDAPPTHWEQVFLPPLVPLRLKSGDRLRLALEVDSRPEVKINLRWRSTVVDPRGRVRTEATQDMREGHLE
jgi:protein arginine N-methyltransferase 1